MRYRRPQLANSDSDSLDAGINLDNGDGDRRGQVLEKLGGATGYDGGDGIAEGAVVDGVGELIGPARRCEVGFHIEVDFERLGPVTLLGQCAANAYETQASQLDPVGATHAGGRARATETSSRPTGPSWRCNNCSVSETARGPLGMSPDHTR